MIIKKMTASFGVLQNKTLELGEGLNIIHAPNESGKTTWCAFISAMLYGISSSAREKGGVKPDKVRYAPWNGVPMAGSMDIEYEGKDITLMRSGRASAPMRQFASVYSGTSEDAGIPAANAGGTLLGVSKDVFERTAFIGQGRVAVSTSPELEKRIAAIVQTGDEHSSYSEAENMLKAAQRKLRYGKSGSLPEIEREIDAISESLNSEAGQERRGTELAAAKQQAMNRRNMLMEKVSEARKGQRKNVLENLTDARERLHDREDELISRRAETVQKEKAFSQDFFGERPLEECAEQVKNDVKKLESYKKQLSHLDRASRNYTSVVIFALLFALFAALAIAGFAVFSKSVLGLVGAVGALGSLAIGLLRFQKVGQVKSRRLKVLNGIQNIESLYGTQEKDKIENLLLVHRENIGRFMDAKQREKMVEGEFNRAKVKLETLEGQTLKNLDFSEGDTEAARLSRMLEQAETDLRRIREEAAAFEGRQSMAADPQELRQRITELRTDYEKQGMEYEALSLALDTLRESAVEIQSRMTPLLGKRCTELFSKLTEGRYDLVELDKELRALTLMSGDTSRRETGFLSTGAIDQLYLALRLAMTELALPVEKSCPIILDDALVNFDDQRTKNALELLLKMAEKRQIILFTCHSREAEMVRFCENVSITCL